MENSSTAFAKMLSWGNRLDAAMALWFTLVDRSVERPGWIEVLPERALLPESPLKLFPFEGRWAFRAGKATFYADRPWQAIADGAEAAEALCEQVEQQCRLLEQVLDLVAPMEES